VQNVEMAYRYGRRGMTMEDVQKHTVGKGMSSEALQAAYDAGMEQGKAEANTAQTAVDDAKGTETVKHGSVQMLHAEAAKNTAEDGGVKYQKNGEGELTNKLEVWSLSIPRGQKIDADRYIEERHGNVLDDIHLHLDELKSMEPVCELDGTEFQKNPDDPRKLKKKVKDYFDSIGNEVYRKEIGAVALNNTGAHDSLEHGYGPIKAACFAALPYVIEKGLMFGPNRYMDRGYDTYLFAAPVRFVGASSGEFYVGAYVIKDVNTTRYKVHEVLTIKKKGSRPFKPEAGHDGEHLRDESPSDTSILENGENSNQKFSTRDQSLAQVNAALERQNERLRQDVSYLHQMVKLQKAIPNNTPAVMETTKQLMHKANATGNAKEAATHLQIKSTMSVGFRHGALHWSL